MPNALARLSANIVLRKSADGSHQAPQAYGHCDDVAAIGFICPARNRNSCSYIEHRKGESCEQTKLAVGQTEVCFDRFLQDRQQLPIYKVEGVNHRQQSKRVITGLRTRVRVCDASVLVKKWGKKWDKKW